MGLKEKINQDLKTAIKAKDQAALRGLRAIKAAILLVETDGSGKAFDDAAEIKLLQQLIKQRKDSLEIFEAQGREDLSTIEKEEIDVISQYLPKQLNTEELTIIIKNIIGKTGASSMKDMGRVMGLATKELGGKADGKTIASVVKSLLS